ncbi:MAG: hypothetical protein RIQ71_368 [Verrucomicrobiota bacterium]|jgi:hypothetical protein
MAGMILRLAGIAACAAAWWWLGSRGQEKGLPGGMLSIVAAHGVLILAAIMMAKPLAGLIGDWLSGLFMPGERFDKPPPMYSIPEGRMAKEDYAGALEAYAELAQGHPAEVAPHLRMMEIWLRVYRDPDSARIIRDNALISLKGKKNKEKFAADAAVLLGETPAS